MQISAVIIAGNEERNIARAVRSVRWADEIIVIDSESTDGTRAIAEDNGATVITRPWPGFSRQKEFGARSAKFDWIFSLDADEEVSDELAASIQSLKNAQDHERADGYRVSRLAIYMGRPIRHSGWYPDRQLRLYDRRLGKWSEVLIHESVEMADGARVDKLSGDILHYSVDDAAHHHRMIGERYAPLAAEQMFANGRRTSRSKIVSVGVTTFFSSYFLRLGILDGLPGFCIAWFAAHHAFLKHLLLWEMQHEKQPASGRR